jgi:hypothetical protein
LYGYWHSFLVGSQVPEFALLPLNVRLYIFGTSSCLSKF